MNQLAHSDPFPFWYLGVAHSFPMALISDMGPQDFAIDLPIVGNLNGFLSVPSLLEEAHSDITLNTVGVEPF